MEMLEKIKDAANGPAEAKRKVRAGRRAASDASEDEPVSCRRTHTAHTDRHAHQFSCVQLRRGPSPSLLLFRLPNSSQPPPNLLNTRPHTHTHIHTNLHTPTHARAIPRP